MISLSGFKLHHIISITLIIFLIVLVVTTILLGSVPPVDRDALTHHLFVPKLWIKHGGIYEIPEIIFSYYPMNLDLLYTIPLYFGNDIIPKYIHYLFAILTGWLIYRHLKIRIGNNYGLLGAIFFLSIPIIVKLSITVYVDLGLVFFTTASLLSLLQWANTNFKFRYILLAGIFCGLSAGTKYNGLISIFILTLFVPIIFQRYSPNERQSNFKAIFYGLVFAAVTVLAFSPWLMKNYIWTGNPIYPLHNSLINRIELHETAATQSITEEAKSTLQEFTGKGRGSFIVRKTLYNESWWQILLLPIRMFFEGQDDDPRFFDGKLTPFLFILPISALIFKSRTPQEAREKRFLFSFTLLYFFLTFFQEALRIRYIVSIVPPLVILSMYGLNGLTDAIFCWMERNNAKTPTMVVIVAGISFLMLGYNTQYILNQFKIVAPFPYVREEISRDQYITAFRPEYPAIQYANSKLPSEAKVLCIFLGNRGYYMDFQPVFEQPYSGGVFSRFLASEAPQHSIFDEMHNQGISHILFRTDLTAEWLQRLNNRDRLRIAPLFSNAERPLWSGNGHVFLAVKPIL